MKIAIIGAGPAGLYAALAAAEKGMTADLYEKRRVGEGIVCGECIFDDVCPKIGVLERGALAIGRVQRGAGGDVRLHHEQHLIRGILKGHENFSGPFFICASPSGVR